MRAFLPAGARLAAWLREGPPHARVERSLWGYRWRGFWFDRNWRMQEALHPVGDFEGEGGRKLLFVVGFWRSGTTLLHELLALGPGMSAPRTWQCMNPSAFRLAKPPPAGASVRRPMDAVVVDARSPQEDEFALLARGAPSAYRAWLDPRRWEEALPALAQQTWLELPEAEWLADWRRFLGWCMPAEAAAMVIKSPNHVFRLRSIHRRWPGARLAWTLRDPVDTWLSNHKMWRAMTAMYGLSDWRPEDLAGLLLQAFLQYAAALRWALGSLGPQQLAFVDFNRLSGHPEEPLEALARRLDLGAWESWRARLQARLDETAGQTPQAYDEAAVLPEHVRTVLREVQGLHRLALDSPCALGER